MLLSLLIRLLSTPAMETLILKIVSNLFDKLKAHDATPVSNNAIDRVMQMILDSGMITAVAQDIK